MMLPASQEIGLRCLLFDDVDQRFALEIGYVEEIILPRPIVPVPLSPPFVEGIINLRGRVVTVFSLRELLELKGEKGMPAAMVVLRIPEMDLALGACGIISIENLQTGIMAEEDPEEEGGLSPVKGVIQHEGLPVNLLDMEKLIYLVVEYDYQDTDKVVGR
jgi:purine-binding chemotaxis protein CheW